MVSFRNKGLNIVHDTKQTNNASIKKYPHRGHATIERDSFQSDVKVTNKMVAEWNTHIMNILVKW